MALRGKAAKALGTAMFASGFGGLFSCIILVIAAPQVAQIALTFGPPEYFGMVFFALSAVALMGDSLVKTLISALLGLLFATVGLDAVYGGARFTFGSDSLLGGFDFVALMVGVRSEEHTSELQSLMRSSYAVFCLHKIKQLNL